jgi:hypothetical protein
MKTNHSKNCLQSPILHHKGRIKKYFLGSHLRGVLWKCLRNEVCECSGEAEFLPHLLLNSVNGVMGLLQSDTETNNNLAGYRPECVEKDHLIFHLNLLRNSMLNFYAPAWS